ncbi:hypothetical protein RJ639_027892 [Escallonia herrerae]|uniref:Cytochrome P450 n=1 Tax=Escallonia herrerae TaxID=1293975 RepID=A0AA88X6Q8_9ASTE|nr:hypothetical protein RJ639_027892 [Escallonia herrerae]
MYPTKSLTGEFTPFFLLTLLSLILVLIFKRSFSKGPPVPPGPYAWPIVGNIFETGKLVHVALSNLAQVHGPLMSLQFGSRLVVVGSSPTVAAEILKSHDRSLSGRKLPLPIRFKGSKLHNLGLGFFDECGDGWRSIRTVYRGKVFSTKALHSQAEVREKKVNEMVAYLESTEGEVVKIKEVVFVTALNILSNIFLSVDFLDYEGKGVAEGMRGYIRRFAVRSSTDCLSDIFPILGDWCFRGTCSKYMYVVEAMFASWVKQMKDGIFMSQEGYAKEVLKKFKLLDSKPVKTPMSLVGSLRYLTCTRPDILFSVGLVSRFMEAPSSIHMKAAKRILRYLKGNLSSKNYLVLRKFYSDFFGTGDGPF